MLRTSFALLALSTLFTSCEFTQDIIDDSAERGYNNVDESLWPYYDRFAIEAELQGFGNMNEVLQSISATISDIDDDGVAGTCQYSSQMPNHVTIDADFWNRSGELNREFVVFHELGHCALVRDHEDACTTDGLYTSLMRSGLGDCRDAYSSQNRQYYLNELFSVTGGLLNN